MLIRYHGHSEFLIETAAGQRILTDPFDPRIPFPQKRVQADLVTISHEHADHCYLDKVAGQPLTLRATGSSEPLPGVHITGYASFHDDAQGAKRGSNTIYVLAAEGLRLAHLGDLGAFPDAGVMSALHQIDVLMLPVGGTYTLDAAQAAELCQLLKPRVIIPMHYKLGQQGLQNIAAVDAFLSLLSPMQPAHQHLLRITAQDITEVPHLLVLSVR